MGVQAVTGAHGRDITAAEAAWSVPHPVDLSGKVTFHDVLAALNPLQYLPGVGSIYRVVTGDDGSPALRTVASLIGGALMGGPAGLITSIVGLVAEHFFPVEHIARTALVTGTPAPAGTGTAAAAAAPAPVAAPAPAAAPAAAAAPAVPAGQALAAYGRAADLTPRLTWGGRER